MHPGPAVERRKNPRHPLITGVQFYHGPSQRDIPGRCVDISRSGMKMYVPPTSPVRPGDPVEVTLGAPNRPEFAVLGETPMGAAIVRVDRSALLTEGRLTISLRFTGE